MTRDDLAAIRLLRPCAGAALAGLLPILLALGACKPPPTDADMRRDIPSVAPTFASDPIASPPSEGALWAESRAPGRIIYGQPGEQVQVALACNDETIEVTRFADADEGAEALLAMVGNGHIGRLEVAAVELASGRFWQGSAPATSDVWEPLTGARQLTLTVPGAGMVTINPSVLPLMLVSMCRGEAILDPEQAPERAQ